MENLLSFWQIWNMSFGFRDTICWFTAKHKTLQEFFETLGAKVDEILSSSFQ
jgi:hypothetical protein